MLSFYDRIRSGEFDTQIPFPKNSANETLRAYCKGLRAAEDRFKVALLKELGILNHPKANRLYEIAWDRGHSSGYEEVYYEARDLADLLR